MTCHNGIGGQHMSLKKTLAVLIVFVLMLSALPVPAMAYSMPYYIEVDLTNQIVTIFNTADNMETPCSVNA